MYRVEKILDKKENNNQVFYKIKWENYPESQCTWEPIKNLKSVKSMIHQFEMKNQKRNPSQSSKSKNGSRIEPKTESKTLIRNRSKSQNQNTNQAQGRKILKKSSNSDQKTQPNDKSSSLEEHYMVKQGKNDDNQDMEELNLSFLSAKINQLTRNKRALKIIDMFKGQNNDFTYQVQREGGRKTIETREYLLNNHYEDEMIQFYESRIQFQKKNQ